ncbi:MAG TPA: (d)CMP kinase [Thermogutta sp.]|nr:(d)CMP kinase [Thermogutta sp.]
MQDPFRASETNTPCNRSGANTPFMVVTIDGPAASGKSTVAKMLAQQLGFRYLDTGAMYRAVALAGLRKGTDWDDADQVSRLLDGLDLRITGTKVFLGKEDVTETIRTPEVTRVTSIAADSPLVRQYLIGMQRAIAKETNLITEGRDQGTVVFPDADCKFFLVASPEERARRRCRDYERLGKPTAYEEVLKDILERDQRDRERPFGGLARAEDAIEINTDNLSPEEVVALIVPIIRAKSEGKRDSQTK